MSNARIRPRRDTLSNWSTINPVLAEGEMGVDTTTNQFKIGDGTTDWNTLSYVSSPGPAGPTGPAGPDGPSVSDGAKGDVTVSGGGTSWQINAHATNVANKVQHLADIPSLMLADTTIPSVHVRDSKRGGLFIWDATNNSANVANDPQQGVFVPPTTDTTGSSGAWVRQSTTLTPYMFGALGGYSAIASAYAGIDDTIACQALLNFWKNYPQYIVDFLGNYWTVTSEITIQQFSSFYVMENPAQMIGGTFVGKTGSSGTRLVTVNAPGAHILGLLGAMGPGDTGGNCITYANRSWDYGIYLVDSSNIYIESWTASNFKCWGFDQATENFANLGNRSNSSGSNIGNHIGPGTSYNCGSAGGQTNSSCLTYTFDSITYNGTSGSVSQTCTCHATTALDPKIAVGDPFVYTHTDGTRQAYSVSAIDLVGNTVTFYFWLPLGTYSGTVSTTWTMSSSHGGALHLHGSNGGISTFGRITGIRAGTALRDGALYGSTVDGVHFEASGINIATGNPPTNATIGGTIGHNHCESTFIQWHQRGCYPTHRIVDCASGYGLVTATPTSQIYHSRPRSSAGLTSTQQGAGGLTYHDGTSWISNENGPGITSGNPGSAFTLSNIPSQRQLHIVYSLSGAQNPTININWDSTYDDLWTGKNWMQAEFIGSGPRGEIAGSVTVQLTSALISAGYTLNGGTSALVFNNFKGAPLLQVFKDTQTATNFVAVMKATNPPSAVTVTTQGDASITLNAGTSSQIQFFNTPLTTTRTITLQTTSAYSGDTFRIIRSATATGSSMLNVGTGPLVALAPGEECVVVYDGSAWQLAESGYLGLTFDTDSSLSANSDSRFASQKAVKAYVDAGVAGGSNFSNGNTRSAGTGTAGTGAFTPTGSLTGCKAWSTVPTGWIGLVRFDDSSAWEESICYWNGTTLSRSVSQVIDSSSGSQLSLSSSATALLLSDDLEVALRPKGLARGSRHSWIPAPNVSTGNLVGLGTVVVQGTAAAIAPANTNYLTEQIRVQYTSATTASAMAGIRIGTGGAYVSPNAGQGGYIFSARWGASVLPTGPRLFVGLNGGTNYEGGTSEPSAYTQNYVVFSLDSTDTTIQFLTNSNSGGGTKIDTAIPFSVNSWYKSMIWQSPGSSTVYGLLIQLDTGTIWFGSTSTDVATNSFLIPELFCSLNGTNTGTAAVFHVGTVEVWG